MKVCFFLLMSNWRFEDVSLFPYRNFIVVWLCYLFHVVEIWSERQTTCLGLTWLFARTKCRFSTSWKILRVYRTSLHGTCISVKQLSCWCDVVLLRYQLTGELDHLKWLPLSLFDLHCTLSGLWRSLDERQWDIQLGYLKDKK